MTAHTPGVEDDDDADVGASAGVVHLGELPRATSEVRLLDHHRARGVEGNGGCEGLVIVGDGGTTQGHVHTRPERRSLTERAVRQRCRDLVRRLELARPVEPVRLVQCLSRHRDRPLVLEARSLPGACAFGLLVSLPEVDMIVYPEDVAPAYQAQIIYHEVMHLWLDHLGPGSPEPGVDNGLPSVGSCGPGGDGEPNRSVYHRREEWEAETGATILSEWSARPATVAATGVELTIARALGSRGNVA